MQQKVGFASRLQSTAGQALNGKVGQLITGKANEEGRFAVKVDGEHSGKLLKGSNLVAVQKEELARTYLLPDHKTLFIQRCTLCSLNVILVAIHQP